MAAVEELEIQATIWRVYANDCAPGCDECASGMHDECECHIADDAQIRLAGGERYPDFTEVVGGPGGEWFRCLVCCDCCVGNCEHIVAVRESLSGSPVENDNHLALEATQP